MDRTIRRTEMSPESSPFTPGQPVPIEFFVGRVKEIEQLRSLVRAAVNGKFKIGFVTGERGIGKTSLVSFVRHLSEREDRVAGAHVFLGGAKDVPDMIRRTLDRLLKENVEKPWYGKLKDFFGKHVGEVGLFGISVELKLTQNDLQQLMHEFVPTIRQLLSKLKGERKAFLLILDDINGLANSAEFANWLKSTVDEIATGAGGLNLCMLIVGLEERRQDLLSIQPSLDRVFALTEIRPWDEAETARFFTETFRNGSATVEDDALKPMVRYTGGLPVIGHEIGDAVWRAAATTTIKESDAVAGIRQAAQIIGSKFLQPKVIDALHSPRYRSILRRIASNRSGVYFSRAELVKLLGPEDKKVLDKFLNRLKELGVIVPNPEAGTGCYRFANLLHYLYFVIEARKADAETKRRNGPSTLLN
jgi:AAA+ ATPase superfamily predicted ATPase